jgi:hypothetical protein
VNLTRVNNIYSRSQYLLNIDFYFYLLTGFRDVYWHLVSEGYNVKIPTCKGLNKLKDKQSDLKTKIEVNDQDEPIQLTTSQTSDTRLVTKV